VIDTSRWKDYRMSKPERAYLDAYLEHLKKNTDPDLPDDEFFAKFCISQILKPHDLDIDQIQSGYTDGPLDGGVDGIYAFVQGKLITDEEAPLQCAEFQGMKLSLHCIQATRSSGFTKEHIRKLEDFSKDLLDDRNNVNAKPKTYNVDIRGAMDRFRNWYAALKMSFPTLGITFHIASKGDGVHPEVSARADQLKAVVKGFYFCDCEVLFYTAKSLLELTKKSRRDPVELKLKEKLESDHWGSAYACLVTMPDYINFISTPSGELREYVLEPNVRGYLGQKGVNADIRNTLIGGSEKEEFWWLNNGITITASKITPGAKSLILENARVVNGLQTSREIYYYSQFKPSAARVDERHILVKVIEASRPVARNITSTTNNQTKVDLMYLLTTTDDIHDMIESAFPKFGFFYERVKNQYYDNDKIERAKIVTLDYLTRALIAILMQRPEQARGSPTQFVKKNYSKVFNRTSKPEVFGNAVRVMKIVDDFVSSRVEAKTERANIRYHLAYYAVCSLLRKSAIQRAMLANLNPDDVAGKVLDVSLARVRQIYSETITARGLVPDVIAKGPDFIGVLKKELEVAYPSKRRKEQEPDLFSGISSLT
jgi:AIPR protein